jgi:chromosome segregation ATPase
MFVTIRAVGKSLSHPPHFCLGGLRAFGGISHPRSLSSCSVSWHCNCSQLLRIGQHEFVKDHPTQSQSGPATLPEDSSGKSKPRLETAKSRVANLLHAFAPKKKATPETPQSDASAPSAPEVPVRPVIGSDRAALFLDAKGNIVAAQPRCARFFRRQPDEISGLNIKELLKPGFDEGVVTMLTKGREASEMSFHVLGLRKDGSEFQTQLSFKYLPEDFGFCWTVFVQAPADDTGESPASNELQQIVPTTETATQSEPPKTPPGEKAPARPVRSRQLNPEKLAAQLVTVQNECKRLERVKFESDKRLRQMQTDYGNRVIQLEQDLSSERQTNDQLSKRLEAQEQSVSAQIKGMRKIKEQHPESAAAPEKSNAELEDLHKRHKALETEAAGIRKERDELRARLSAPATQTADPKSNSQNTELTGKLEKASSELQALRKAADENEAAQKQLKVDLDKERDANKLSQKKAEEIHAQFQKLKGDAEQAEARVRESSARCTDFEKKVADLSKTTDELSKSNAEGKSAGAQSAQRVKELEQQLKRANDEQAASKTELEKQNAARQKLEADNRTLTEASTKTKAELNYEHEANKVAHKKEEELKGQVQKLQNGVEQAETRARQSATQLKDSEIKIAEIKKTVDDLIRSQGVEKTAAAQSAKRIKELEDQLKGANANLATSKTELEKQNAARQKVDAENRTLTEANSRTNADLDMERDAHKLFRQKAEELSTQVKNSHHAAEQAEARARENAAQAKDWEKKAADLKKSVDELARNHATEKTAAAQSAQRVKELEQLFKRTGDELTASKTEIEKQNSARIKLEADHRNLTDAGAKTKAELDKEREANKLSRQKAEELSAQVQKLQPAAEQAQARVRELTSQNQDWEKKSADLKKSVDELTRSNAAEKNASAQSAQRVQELEQQLKRASDEFAAGKAEVEKQLSTYKHLEAQNRELAEASARAKAELTESAKNQAALQKRAADLEQRMREGVSSLAKATAEVQSERVERERAEKVASSATTHLQQVNEMLERQLELERSYRSKIAELEKAIHDRGDDLARASAALRKETKERQIAQKQSRLVSDMGGRLESNLASLDDAKKTFEASLQEKDDRLQVVERSLANTQSNLEKESTERRRADGLLTEAKRQLEKVSGESKVEISRLQAALDLAELQRKQLEGDLLRTSDAAQTAEQGLSTTLDNLRLELRQPVEDLRQSACSLLESKVTDSQKHAIELVLEKALFLQVTLKAAGKPHSESNPQANGQKADSRNKTDSK